MCSIAETNMVERCLFCHHLLPLAFQATKSQAALPVALQE